MSGGESSSSGGYREHFVDDFIREFSLEDMGNDPEFRRLVKEAAGIIDKNYERNFGVDPSSSRDSSVFDRDYWRMMYGYPPPRTPNPDEELTEETAPTEIEDLVRQCGPEIVLQAMMETIIEMGDLASVLMIARARAHDLYRQTRKESYRHVDLKNWRDRGDHYAPTGRRRPK